MNEYQFSDDERIKSLLIDKLYDLNLGFIQVLYKFKDHNTLNALLQ